MEPHDNQGRPIETWRVRALGRVQGVGYRDACVRCARALGVTGWVRNRADGSVEAMLHGSTKQLGNLCDWLRDGVPAARVDRLDASKWRSPAQYCGRHSQGGRARNGAHMPCLPCLVLHASNSTGCKAGAHMTLIERYATR